jgi:hypothetical protein
MKTSSLLQLVKGAFIALIAITLGSTAAQAQATRTWVSGVGDDVNPCSRTAPCKTFAGCISKTAAGGEISVLDPGGFGTLTITKSIIVDGGGIFASTLASGATQGFLINITSPGTTGAIVKLRNLSINGAGTTLGVDGIRVLNAAEVTIENCEIANFSGKGINIVPTAACSVAIKNTYITRCGLGAVFASPAATGVAINISKSSLNDSSLGFRAENNVKAVLDDCVIAGNTNNAVVVQPTSGVSKVTVSRCTISDSGGYGVLANGSLANVWISNNVIFNNGIGVGVLSSGVITSLGNNNINGNTTDGTPAP